MNPLHVQLLIKILAVLTIIASGALYGTCRPTAPWARIAAYMFTTALGALAILVLVLMLLLT